MAAEKAVYAERVMGIGGSATLAVSTKVRQMKRAGIDVVDLGGGDPDFPTPAHIVEAAHQAMREGFTHYVSSRGIKELLDAIALKLEGDNGLTYDPDTQIVVTPSGKHALFACIMALVNPGDEVLVLDPSWVTYKPCVQLAGGVPVEVALDIADNYRITAEKLRQKLSPRTKALIVNSPNNPTGRVLTRQELEAIAQVAREADLVVVADEIYEKIIYDDRQHISLASLPGMMGRTLTLNGFSKAYAMTGWRLGYGAGPKEMINQILKVQEHSVSCAASFAQRAGVAALTGPQGVVAEMAAQYAARRNLIADGLNRLPGVTCHRPDGAFYAFPNISATGMSAAEFADFLLREAHVGVTPGDAFGPCGEGFVRLSFAAPTESLAEALERMAKALGARA